MILIVLWWVTKSGHGLGAPNYLEEKQIFKKCLKTVLLRTEGVVQLYNLVNICKALDLILSTLYTHTRAHAHTHTDTHIHKHTHTRTFKYI